MATLVHHWPMNEGAGTTLTDVVGGLDATLFVRGGYPIWVNSGPGGSPALRFNGTFDSIFSGDPATDIERAATTAVDTLCARNRNFAISIWVNLQGATRPRPIFAWQYDVTEGAYIDSRFHDVSPFVMLYLGTDGKFWFGWGEVELATQHFGGVASIGVYAGSTDWVHIVGRQWGVTSTGEITPDGHLYDGSGSALVANIYHDIWINYVPQSQRTFPSSRLFGSAIQAKRYGFGRASPMSLSGLNTYPATRTPTRLTDNNGSDGALLGDIRDARIYCGYYNPLEPPPPSVQNSIMFSCNT